MAGAFVRPSSLSRRCCCRFLRSGILPSRRFLPGYATKLFAFADHARYPNHLWQRVDYQRIRMDAIAGAAGSAADHLARGTRRFGGGMEARGQLAVSFAQSLDGCLPCGFCHHIRNGIRHRRPRLQALRKGWFEIDPPRALTSIFSEQSLRLPVLRNVACGPPAGLFEFLSNHQILLHSPARLPLSLCKLARRPGRRNRMQVCSTNLDFSLIFTDNPN